MFPNKLHLRPPKDDLFQIDTDFLFKNPDPTDSCYRIKTEGNQNSSSNLPKSSLINDWKAFFQNGAPQSQMNIKPINKKEEGLFLYREDKDEKESEKSLEVAKALFVNLKNDLVNVFEDPNNSNSNNNSNVNGNVSGEYSAGKMKTQRLEIPSEKKTTQIKVFTTHDHNIEGPIVHKGKKEVSAPYFPRKELMKKPNLTIRIEKTPEGLINNIANKVRESKECHNITQLNESTKNKNRKRFLFKEPETMNNFSLNDMKSFPKTTKNKETKQTETHNLFFKAVAQPTESLYPKNNVPASTKHERIKSLDFNSKKRLIKGEDGDLLKKLHYQKVDIMNNEEVRFRIKEVLDSKNPEKKADLMKGKKKVIDADVTYFKK